jgi:hypothetical protein
MRRAFILAITAAVFGACSSGGGCGGAKPAASDAAPAASGGRSTGEAGGESVSFQGTPLGSRSADGGVLSSSSAASAAKAVDPTIPGTMSVLCGGFPGLADDCMVSPRLPDLQKKCCPSGVVVACRAISGGARLIGRGCAASTATAAPQP